MDAPTGMSAPEWPEFIGGPVAGERVPHYPHGGPITVPVRDRLPACYGDPDAEVSFRVEMYARRLYQFAPGVVVRGWVHTGTADGPAASELAGAVVNAALSEVHRAER